MQIWMAVIKGLRQRTEPDGSNASRQQSLSACPLKSQLSESNPWQTQFLWEKQKL
jgi:hypothetical protein